MAVLFVESFPLDSGNVFVFQWLFPQQKETLDVFLHFFIDFSSTQLAPGLKNTELRYHLSQLNQKT